MADPAQERLINAYLKRSTNPDDQESEAILREAGWAPRAQNPDDSFLTAKSWTTGNAYVDDLATRYLPDAEKQALQHNLYDPNAFEYGGSRAGDAEANRLNQMAGYYRTSRAAPTLDTSVMDPALAQAMVARGQQAEALGMYGDAATGSGPTAAPSQLALANSMLQQQAAASMAGARTPAQQAAVRNAAMGGVGQAMGQNALGAAQLRAGEQFAGMGGMQGVSNQMFGGDMRGMQMQQGLSDFRSNLSAQGQAQNDAMERYYAGLRQQTLGVQQSGRIAREQFQQDQVHQAAGLRAKSNADFAQRNQREYEDASRQGAAGFSLIGQYASGGDKK